MKTKIILFLFFISSLIFAQSPKELLKVVQNKFNSMNNFSANFTQMIYNLEGEKAVRTSGKFMYKRKNKFIAEMKSQTIVSDGATIWNSDKKFNRVIISTLVDDPSSFSLERFVFDYPPLCKIKSLNEKYLEKGEFCLELTPKDQDMAFKTARIWCSNDGMIYKMEVIDGGDIKYQFLFSEIKLNQDLPDSKFVFYPSKGMQIIDIR
jgi:outer membrane lipoprotein carrier protein